MKKIDLLGKVGRWNIGIDDTFQFHCTQCGKCCKNREDIILSPRDMYFISRHLRLSPHEVLSKYCETYIGNTSRVPLVRLKPMGKSKQCPFLKDHKCEIHNAKPTVCAIYPLGRYIQTNPNTDELESQDGQMVRYMLQPVICGDKSETHTVREWLNGFDHETEDKFYIAWTRFVSQTSRFIKNNEAQYGSSSLQTLWNVILVGVYLAYKTDEEFLPQFEKNVAALGELYGKLNESVDNQ